MSSDTAIEYFEQCHSCFNPFDDAEKEQIWDAYVTALPYSAFYFSSVQWGNWHDMKRINTLVDYVSKQITGINK